MTDNSKLSETELDMLFAVEGAKIEMLVELARFELSTREQRKRLTAAAERAQDRQAEIARQIVLAHGFDPDQFETDIEKGCIVRRGDVGFSLSRMTSETDLESRRGTAFKLKEKGEHDA